MFSGSIEKEKNGLWGQLWICMHQSAGSHYPEMRTMFTITIVFVKCFSKSIKHFHYALKENASLLLLCNHQQYVPTFSYHWSLAIPPFRGYRKKPVACCISPNHSKTTNHRQISLTRTDHHYFKLSKNIQFEKDIYVFLQYFRKSFSSTFVLF